MTVKQLIEKLQALDPEMQVRHEFEMFPVDGVELRSVINYYLDDVMPANCYRAQYFFKDAVPFAVVVIT